MIGNSDTNPDIVAQSNNKTQIRYNIEEVTEPHAGYNFEYIEISGEVTRSKIIETIIETQFDKSAELALINNKLLNEEVSEYNDYQTFRAFAKSVADSAGYTS